MSARLVGWALGGRIDVTLGEQVKIGAAAQNDVTVAATGVSGSHARIERGQGVYWIEDAKSRNGTWLNGTRVTRSRLRHLDVVSLADGVDLVFLDRGGGEEVMSADERLVRLEWLDGAEAGSTCDVPPGGLTIGRAADSGLVIKSGAVSRRHARIVRDKGDVTVEDLGSANGTQVNDRPIAILTLLRDGDTLQVGDSRFRVRIAEAAEKAIAMPPMEAPHIDQEWRTRMISPGDLVGLPPPTIRLAPEAEPAVLVPGPPMETVPQTVFVDPTFPVVPAGLEPSPAAEPPEQESSATVFVENQNLIVPKGIGVIEDEVTEGTVFGLPPITRGVPTSVLNASASSAPPDAPEIATSSGSALTGIRLSGTQGTFTLLLGEATVGRAPESTVRLDRRDVSRLHATIVVSREQAILEDKGSANRTTVNGSELSGPYLLQEGDRVKFGDAEFRAELLSEGRR